MPLTFLPLDLTASLIAGLVAMVLMGSDHEDGGWGGGCEQSELCVVHGVILLFNTF
jgi:hypothetical protein